MRYNSIKTHLRPYSITARRTTTINHAFAAAIAPNDAYDDAMVRSAIAALEQNPDADLICAYCNQPAETWDHIFPTVKGGKSSGHGHHLGNLLPCCKLCNSRKGGKSWQAYLKSVNHTPRASDVKRTAISSYLDKLLVIDSIPESFTRHQELDAIKAEVLRLCERADALAAQIRSENHITSNNTGLTAARR